MGMAADSGRAGARVGFTERSGIGQVTIGSGSRSNALRAEDWTRLRQLAFGLGQREGLRCVVIRGAGDNFCAGSDLTQWASAGQATIEADFREMEAALRAVEEMPMPVIAAVRGAAVGAGCQLALACDLRVVAAGSTIGMPTARLGILPTASFAVRLARVAGPGRARELLYTGRLLTGPQAAAAGLAESCVPDSELDTAVQSIVSAIAAQPAAVIAATKAALASIDPVYSPAARDDTAPTVLTEVMTQALARYAQAPEGTPAASTAPCR
jgi:enoyl-CoA hydratase/carnithine racemase